MAHYFKAEYPNGQVVERRNTSLRGLVLNGQRPHTLSVVPEAARELNNARRSVHPRNGKVVELSNEEFLKEAAP